MEDQQNNQLQSFDAEPPTSQPPVPAPPVPQPTGATPESPTPKKKKGLIIGLIIAAALVVLGAVGALAYNFWYQNPEKVITDSLVNAIKAKSVLYSGSISMTGSQEYNIELRGKSDAATGDLTAKVTTKVDGKDVTLNGSALIDDKGDLYFKVTNVGDLTKLYRDAQAPDAQALVDGLITKVDNQWIKISADDLKLFGGVFTKGQICLNDAFKKLQSDKNTASEITDTYKKHKFITVEKKLGSQNGSLGYQLKSDTVTAKAFAADLKNTALYKSLHECDPSIVIDENEMFKTNEGASTEETRVEIWVSRWSHQITKLATETTMSEGDKGIVLIEPKFNEKVDAAKAPETSTTLSQLQADIEALIQAAMSSPMTSENAWDTPIYPEL